MSAVTQKLAYGSLRLSMSFGDFLLAPTRPIENVTLWEGFLYLMSGSEADEGVVKDKVLPEQGIIEPRTLDPKPNMLVWVSHHPASPRFTPLHPASSRFAPLRPASSRFAPLRPASPRFAPLHPASSRFILLHPASSPLSEISLHASSPRGSRCPIRND